MSSGEHAPMATGKRSLTGKITIPKGTVTHRWNLIQEIAKIPSAASYKDYAEQFKSTKSKDLRNANRLLIQWMFNGWMPHKDNSGEWDYKNSFIQNQHVSLVTEAGMRFAALIELIEFSKTSPKFLEIFDESKQCVQKIRCHLYEERWRKYGLEWLSNTPIKFQTSIDEKAFLGDLFRLMCFDFVVRRKSLLPEEICVISNIIQEPARYGITDLATFRNHVDSESDDIRKGVLSVTLGLNWHLSASYHFQEFCNYEETFGIKLFSTVEGDLNKGFVYDGGQDCFTELLQRLEE